MIWMTQALAAPLTLDELLAGMPPSAPIHAGRLVVEGHGPRPGHTTTRDFATSAVAVEGGEQIRWTGDGWADNFWLTTSVEQFEDGQWSHVPPLDVDREAIQRLAPRPEALLRWIARDRSRVRWADGRLLWAARHGLATLSFDDGRLARLELPLAHPVYGDVVETVIWTGPHTTMSGTTATGRWVADFEPRGGELPAADTRSRAPAVQVSERLGQLRVLDVPEANVRTVAVAYEREGVVVDPPLNTRLGTELRETLQREFPAVTRWTVVLTHHHPHHAGGIRAWHGATFVVHEAIVETVRAILVAERTFVHDPALPDPKLRSIRKEVSLLDGRVKVRPIDQQSGHTDAFLLPYFVPQRVVFVADLASLKSGATTPRSRGTWASGLRDWKPDSVISGFPLDDAQARWPAALLEQP